LAAGLPFKDKAEVDSDGAERSRTASSLATGTTERDADGSLSEIALFGRNNRRKKPSKAEKKEVIASEKAHRT
ncbi:MAG: hypothetical protein AAFN12_08000, partial [Cyanobacteria bacterium J06560_2]